MSEHLMSGAIADIWLDPVGTESFRAEQLFPCPLGEPLPAHVGGTYSGHVSVPRGM